jgi:hypothetical protein
MATLGPEILLDGEPVEKLEFHAMGDFLWIRFHLADGKKWDSLYLKGEV